MASKRKELVSSLQSQAKKPKRDPQAEKLKKQLQEVMAAINKAPIRPGVEQMLESVMFASLGEYRDQRHRFQEQVVEAIEGVLGEAEATLRKETADLKSQLDVALGEKSHREKEHLEASDKLKAKVDEVQRVKVALAAKALAFRSATQFLADAEETRNIDAKKSQEAEKKRSDFEVLLETLNVLKVVLPEDAEACQKRTGGLPRRYRLMAQLTKHKFEESLMMSLPAALDKVPDARGQFDLMALTELEGALNKLITEQSQTISAAAPSQEKCQAAVAAAEGHLVAVRTEQRSAAREFDVASEELVACEATAAASQKASRDLIQVSKRLQTSLTNAEVEVELFQQGPLETFKELCQRVTPISPAEEDVTLPAPMVDEQIAEPAVMEVQVLVAAC